MDENHQDKTGSNLITTENELWLPPLSLKDQEKLNHLRNKQNEQKKVDHKWRWGFSDKTGWDWLQLLLQLLTALALPVALFLGTQWFSAQQNQTSLQISERQHQTDLQIADDQQRETTLKTYLDDMSNLLLNNKLLESKPGDAVRQVARERTLTTLRRLDAKRNGIVIQFLRDAHLIGGKNAVIDLSHADLSGDDLRGASLSGASLSGAFLFGANLSYAYLGGADLSYAFLFGANLSYAYLGGAGLSYAYLRGADLRGASLLQADLSHANLNGANLSSAFLSETILKGARYNTKEILRQDWQGRIFAIDLHIEK